MSRIRHSAFKKGLRTLPTLALAFVAASACAQTWSLEILNPSPGSGANAIYGTQVAGISDDGYAPSVDDAGFWSLTTGAWTTLYPAGSYASTVFATDGSQQAGVVLYSQYATWNAAMWSGTADSFVNLNPTGSYFSTATGVSDGEQVGWADIGDTSDGGLWTGTADSWVDLTPSVATGSEATGIYDGQEVGFSEIGGEQHAGLWENSADSWVDLNPTGYQSVAEATDGAQQVGAVSGLGSTPDAALWSGSADSFVDLNPTGALTSEALAVSDGIQVGSSTYLDSKLNLFSEAGYWTGTADSWVDLAPSWADSSWATGMYTLDGVTYIVGSAAYDDQSYTLVWTDAAVSGGAWQGLNGPGPGGSAVPAPAAGLTFLAAAALKRRRKNISLTRAS